MSKNELFYKMQRPNKLTKSKSENWGRCFLFSSGVILTMTGLAKIFSAFGSAGILHLKDPIFGISFAHLMLVVGILECSVSLFCFFGRNTLLQSGMVALLAANFIAYRVGLVWIGYQEPCPCLGTITDALPISHGIVTAIMRFCAAYLLVGSITTWLLIRSTSIGYGAKSPAQRQPSEPSVKVSVLLLMVAIGSVFSGRSSSIDQFKSFLAQPPIITNLVYEVEYQMVGNGYPTNVPLYFQARWQTNAYLMRQLSSVDDVDNFSQTNHNTFYLQFNDKYCFLPPDDIFRVWDNQHVSQDAQFHPYGLDAIGKRQLSIIMNLGIIEMPIGSITWSENYFISTNNEEKRWAKGRIAKISNGLPTELDYLSGQLDSGMTWHYLIRYLYNTNVSNCPGYIPARIAVYIREKSAVAPFFTMHILSLRTNISPQGEDAFNYHPFLSQTRKEILFYTNQIAYAKFPGKPEVKVQTHVPPMPTAMERKHRRYIVLGIMITSAAIFILIVGIRIKQNNQKKGRK